MNRCIAPISKALLAGALAMAASMGSAMADAPIKAVYGQQPIVFAHVSSTGGVTAVGVNDSGFRALLRACGAAVTWNAGDRYVLITTSAPVVVSFAVGDRRYDVGPISLQAAIAPYVVGDEVYLPLNEVLRSLDLAMRQDGGRAVLQPQLDSLEVRSSAGSAEVIARGGAPLHPRVVGQSAGSVSYEFDGVGTTLAGTRTVNAGGIRTLQIAQAGTIREPKTIVTVQLAPGASHDVPRNNNERDVTIAFSASGTTASTPPAPQDAATAEPATSSDQTPTGAPVTAPGPASVTGVTVTPSADGFSVTIAIAGNATFEWHRLRDPDNRFWVDVRAAQLQGPPIDASEPAPLGALRVRQVDPATVRIALSLDGPKSLAISPSATGLTVAVGRDEVADAPRSGSGSVGSVIASGEQAAMVTPAPLDQSNPGSGADNDAAWKFGPRNSYVPTNPRLIVIDPGHGGSDRGSSRHGVDEADLALDMSKRLRDILLARGWQVRLTHDTDVDVYAPNDSAHDELQARVDVANHAGARIFISIHANAYINSGPYGTTYYISKGSDLALARAVERDLASDGTKDDGIVKSHLYVTLHALMPAVLIETAFISNPSDFALLTSAAWRQRVAQSIADGIDEYSRQYPVPNQPAQ
ncbi:MAG: N-acetylmuramoyl-L-alanine amidase [Candidatus Tumulicola sp.]